MEKIERLLKGIEKQKKAYLNFLRKGERIRKRERDTFLTEKDRVILIESVVAGAFLENILTEAAKRFLKFL